METRNSRRKQESNFVIQGSILAAASIIVRLIGIAYRIPMVNIIGDEGMGYYGTAFNVYNIALLLSSYSLPLAVSKLVSARLAGKQYRNAGRILRDLVWSRFLCQGSFFYALRGLRPADLGAYGMDHGVSWRASRLFSGPGDHGPDGCLPEPIPDNVSPVLRRVM